MRDTPGMDNEITYEADPDAIPIPEGYNGLDDPIVQAAATAAAQETYKSVVDAMRMVRRTSPGTVGHGSDRYEENGREDASGENTDSGRGDGSDRAADPEEAGS